jgi:hypothetical protein
MQDWRTSQPLFSRGWIETGVVERLLIARHPERKKLFRTLSWIERITFGSVAAYQNSAHHFRQAGINRRLARR